MSDKTSNDVQGRAIDSAPRWVFSVAGIILVFAISLKIVGIDISPSINRIMEAQATRIELEAKAVNIVDTSVIRRVETLEEDVESLKQVAHAPDSKKLPFK
ncbi:TMhelix containing protein [Vibrio phage 1.121.O._10N.286.46.C4]|nr:TMhelix containing protein [Vibrio phage 1.121.O._10N.286.46.C4]